MNLKGGWSHSRTWITIHRSGNCLRDLITVLVFLKFYWLQHAANTHDLGSDPGSRDSHDLVRNFQSRVKPKYNGRSGTNEFEVGRQCRCKSLNTFLLQGTHQCH